MNAQISRYNENGSENLDYWFGVRTSVAKIEIVTEKPRYVRYTMEALKKRSTKRLETMHNNLFGFVAERAEMIKNLFNRLQKLWNEYTSFIKVAFGITGDSDNTGKRGRKPKFEENQVYQMLQMKYEGYTLVEIAKAFDTNIATVSQTINGKGTYAYIVNPRLIVRASNKRYIYS
jgi:hypothetical protein